MSARVLAAGTLRRGSDRGRVKVHSERLGLMDPAPLDGTDRAACERLRNGGQGRQLLDSLVAPAGEVQS